MPECHSHSAYISIWRNSKFFIKFQPFFLLNNFIQLLPIRRFLRWCFTISQIFIHVIPRRVFKCYVGILVQGNQKFTRLWYYWSSTSSRYRVWHTRRVIFCFLWAIRSWQCEWISRWLECKGNIELGGIIEVYWNWLEAFEIRTWVFTVG